MEPEGVAHPITTPFVSAIHVGVMERQRSVAGLAKPSESCGPTRTGHLPKGNREGNPRPWPGLLRREASLLEAHVSKAPGSGTTRPGHRGEADIEQREQESTT